MSHLVDGRAQMGTTLAFHLSFAVFGVGLPVMMLTAEGLHLRAGDRVWLALARRWSKAFAILFAVGAVSGTIISFEPGLLWPGFTRIAGGIIGLPFLLEGFAFFLEAIFLWVYLYGWDRLAPRVHWLAGLPIALSGIASAFFIVTANAWMNVPRGFRFEHGRITHIGIFIDGEPVPVPAQIGIDPQGRFVAPLHTHDATGIVHIESQRPYPFTLGQFFTIWGVRFTDTRIGGYANHGAQRLRAFVNGRPVAHPAGHVLRAHDRIVLGYGPPHSFPTTDHTAFPPGL